jgi:hypothetical protein
VWTWEIQSRPKPLGIKLGGADFNSEPVAKIAGEKALIEFLDRLGREEGNVLCDPGHCGEPMKLIPLIPNLGSAPRTTRLSVCAL